MYYPNLAPGAPGYPMPYYQQPVYTPPVVTPAPQPVATGEEKFIVINGGKNAALSYPTACLELLCTEMAKADLIATLIWKKLFAQHSLNLSVKQFVSS